MQWERLGADRYHVNTLMSGGDSSYGGRYSHVGTALPRGHVRRIVQLPRSHV